MQGIAAGKKRIEGEGGWVPQGRVTGKGREKGVIRLGLGFWKVQREKEGMLMQDQYIYYYYRERERETTNVQRQ